MYPSRFNHLVSLKKHLSSDFVSHIEKTKNLCVYKLGNHYIPQNICFPNAHSLTLINCRSFGINNILNKSIFPNIHTINYLSLNTENYDFHKRFSNDVKWVFPDKNYQYFNSMVENGLGKKDSEIIKRFIANKKILNGANGYDVSFEFDLNIPGYGIVSGEWWRSQFYEYLVKKQNIDDHKDCLYPGEVIYTAKTKVNQELEESIIEKEIIAEQLQHYSIDNIIDEE